MLTLGLISVFATLLGTMISLSVSNKSQRDEMKYNAEQAQINRDFQREEREQSQEFEVDMWNKNNEYNSIGSQLERAKAAGVSPNAVIGGNYTTVASQPVTTSPANGSQASYSSGLPSSLAGLGSSMTGGLSSLMSSLSKSQLDTQQHAWNLDTWDIRKQREV